MKSADQLRMAFGPWLSHGQFLKIVPCFMLTLFLGISSSSLLAQRTIVLTQTEADATVGLDRKDFGGPYSQGYHHDFDLGSS
ncbi:MAG: hypothetical protein AAFY48_08300, partial [Bacteroidota bacterium]